MWVGWRLNVNCKLHDVREKLSTQRLRQATGNDGIPHVLQWTGMMMMMMMMMMKQGNSGQYLKQHNKRRGLMSWCPKSKEGNKTGIQEHKKNALSRTTGGQNKSKQDESAGLMNREAETQTDIWDTGETKRATTGRRKLNKTREDKSTKIKQEMETKSPNCDRTVTYKLCWGSCSRLFYSRRILRMFTEDHTSLKYQ